jgi:Eukaryotic translation initiation factor 3 subunit 7 (eIF-3)
MQQMTTICLNEYALASIATSDPALQVINWREKIDLQHGTVLANELNYNSFKLAKWLVQSILAGADQMKINFVSHASSKNANEHMILATQFYCPMDLHSKSLCKKNRCGVCSAHAV